MLERVVVRYNDGRLIKGLTEVREVEGDELVLSPVEDPLSTMKVQLGNAKAIFFVKSFDGSPQRPKLAGFPSGSCDSMSHVLVEFKDGERLWGCTGNREVPTIAGRFSFAPADPSSNNERVYVVPSGVSSVVHD